MRAYSLILILELDHPMAIASNDVFQDETKAREWLEGFLWPAGPVCPHCGLIACATALRGKKCRPGLWRCKGCEKQFTVTVGTAFEHTYIPLNKWLLALDLLTSSTKCTNAHQIHRVLGITYTSALFMCYRLREAMRNGSLPTVLDHQNEIVAVDETYVGGTAPKRKDHFPRKEPATAPGQVHKRTRGIPS